MNKKSQEPQLEILKAGKDDNYAFPKRNDRLFLHQDIFGWHLNVVMILIRTSVKRVHRSE